MLRSAIRSIFFYALHRLALQSLDFWKGPCSLPRQTGPVVP